MVKSRAFTLIEMVIAVSIIALLAGVSFKMLGGGKDYSDLENTCNIIASYINKTRNYALTGKVIDQATGAVPNSFTVTITENNISISGTGEAYAFPNFFTLSGGNTYEFSVPNGAMASGVPGDITISKGSASKTVTVDQYKATCNQ